MKTITIQIPEMQSAHCQLRVNKAITDVEGVTIAAVLPGIAVVSFENETQHQNIIRAIEATGYKTVESEAPADCKGNEVLYFKTNINCAGCVSKVSSDLNAAEGICHWAVNTNSRDKVLTVHTKGISSAEIIRAVRNAGFEIESINA